ncbi:MAG: hypothetical protein V4732_18775 [Pseudomonadota bacterium]
MSSGKQILNNILSELTTRITTDSNMDSATDKIRSGLLYHGSTSDENVDLISAVRWGSQVEDGRLIKQGITSGDGKVFLADFIETLFEAPDLNKYLLEQYPSLNDQAIEALKFSAWLLVSSAQMFTELLPVEKNIDTDMDMKMKVKNMTEKIRFYMENKHD